MRATRARSEKARERQLSGLKQGPVLPKLCKTGEPINTESELAKEIGVGKGTTMKPWHNGPEAPREPYPIQRDPGEVPPDQQSQDIAGSIIHNGRLPIAKINSKLSHYNSAFYGFNRIIEEIGE